MNTLSNNETAIKAAQQYSQNLASVLYTRDPKQLQKFVQNNAQMFSKKMVKKIKKDEKLAELILHKVTCQHPLLKAFHEESRKWLRDRGYSEFLY